MPRILCLLAMVVPLLTLSRSTGVAPPPLPQDAYVWQRLWSPAVVAALQSSYDLVAQWRVLTAETDGHGTLEPVAIDWNALAATRRPVIAVVRIDGSLVHWNETALLGQIRGLAAGWRKRAARLAGIEIDFDCATSRLGTYAGFLKRVRMIANIPARLSITALPAWMASPGLDDVLATADEAVLQVHAVSAPQEGLFDPDQARGWIDTFDARVTKPFRVALPDYGARVVWGEDGRLLAIESEMPRLAGGARTVSLMAYPEQVARLLQSLRRAPPEHLAGIVWFRLPTEQDALTWSPQTWRAVVTAQQLRTTLAVTAVASTTPGMTNIVLVNRGAIDAELPRVVGLPSGCRLADGVSGYTLGDADSLLRLQTALLRARHSRTIGWMRCSGGNFDVRP